MNKLKIFFIFNGNFGQDFIKDHKVMKLNFEAMNIELLFWVYLANAIILINHEIDSAYWQEWKLISSKDQNGINAFLILHFPMLFIILYGLVLVHDQRMGGLICSLLLAAGGIFAYFFHTFHLRKGKPEFNTGLSKSIIYTTAVISVFQMVLTIKLMAG